MRKLVSIQQINEIKQIPDADAIELVIIKGWQCVAKYHINKGNEK